MCYSLWGFAVNINYRHPVLLRLRDTSAGNFSTSPHSLAAVKCGVVYVRCVCVFYVRFRLRAFSFSFCLKSDSLVYDKCQSRFVPTIGQTTFRHTNFQKFTLYLMILPDIMQISSPFIVALWDFSDDWRINVEGTLHVSHNHIYLLLHFSFSLLRFCCHRFRWSVVRRALEHVHSFGTQLRSYHTIVVQ